MANGKLVIVLIKSVLTPCWARSVFDEEQLTLLYLGRAIKIAVVKEKPSRTLQTEKKLIENTIFCPLLHSTKKSVVSEVVVNQIQKQVDKMEQWQQNVIKANLPKLINITLCTTTLISKFLAEDIITDEEEQDIFSRPKDVDKAAKLYSLLKTRKNSYQLLLKVCKEENQSGVVSILENGEIEHNLKEALHECNVTEFICQCFISTSDFESIVVAIAKYSEIAQFEKAFEKNKGDKPWLFRGPKRETLLHVATAYGYINLMKYFISKDIDVNGVDLDGRTAGHYLGKYSTNIIETTKCLISKGLNILHVDKSGMTVANTLAIHNKVNQFHYQKWVEHIVKEGHKEVFAPNSKTGSTALHYALTTMDMRQHTLELLNFDSNVNLTDIDGRTILHVALLFGRNLETIQNLLKLGADHKIKDKAESSVLHFAVEGGKIEVVKFIISFEPNINIVDTLKETPLHKVRFTKSRDYLGMTKFLLGFETDLLAKDKNGNTVAHLFAFAENMSADDFQTWVRGMINDNRGNLFASRGEFGRTPLQTAMKRLDLELDTIKLILDSSMVDINQEDYAGSTLLQLAMDYGRSHQTIKNLRQLGACTKIQNKTGALHRAVVEGNTEGIQSLIRQGFDVNEKYTDENTPLHFVPVTRPRRYVELTKFLLDNGADLYSKKNKNNTVAHEMARCGDVSCDDFKIWVAAIIENGHTQLFTIRGIWGRTPLHCLVMNRDADLETIKLITESAKLDINVPDDSGSTILRSALVLGRSFDTIKSLVKLGADWKRIGWNDPSVLHSAVEGSNKEAFLYFKSLGADVNATDEYGKTPLHYVIRTRSKEYLGMTKFLLENGANLNANDNFAKTLDHYMPYEEHISAEEYAVWKEGMIELGYAAFFSESLAKENLVD